MKLGLLLATQSEPGADLRGRVRELVEQVRLARACGLSSIWLAQHYLTAPMAMFQPGPLLPYLLHEARGMTVGGDIIVLPVLNPVAVAEDAATLDVLSDGHYVLGVGLGYREQEFEAFGVPLADRVPRFVESVGLIRRLWREDRVTHNGRFFKITDAGCGIRPLQRGGPPIWMAAQVEVAVKRVAEIGDAWLIPPGMPYRTIVELMGVYRNSLRENRRPDPADVPCTRECYVGATQAAAMEECREALKAKYEFYASWGHHAQKGQAKPTPIDEMARDRFFIGDRAWVKDEIARYREAGINHFIMRVQWPGFPQSKVLESIRRLGEIVAGH